MAIKEHVEKFYQGVEVWNAWRERNPDIKPDLSGADLADHDRWQGSVSWNASKWFRKVDLPYIDMSGCNLSEANLATLNLTRANFTHASLKDACLYKTKLHEALLEGTDVRSADFRGAIFNNTLVENIIYKRSLLTDKCLGVRGIETAYGDARFRRDVVDQDFIDMKRQSWKKNTLKRVFLLWPWAFIDYGRSIVNVLFLSTFMICVFGFSYPWLWYGEYIQYTDNIGILNAVTPFYVSAIAFSTLGFTDLVIATSWVGQAVLIANVMSGYVMLGVLLSILANGVARRA